MATETHPDVEFAVTDEGGQEHTFSDWDEAAGLAIGIALSTGRRINLDVLIWSEEGADFYGGAPAVDQFNEDPEASVFERIEITANNLGRVP